MTSDAARGDRCVHGVKIGAKRSIWFAGGVCYCRCCQNPFGCFSAATTFCPACNFHRLPKEALGDSP